MGMHQIKMHLHIKGKTDQKEENIHRMRENLYKISSKDWYT
jgi:hypothetical protein